MTRRSPLRQPLRILTASLLLSPAATLAADPHGLTGDWKTPGGSIIRLAPCAGALCLRVITLSPTAPGNLDLNNPDPNLRNRPLCNLEIGTGFTPDGDHATGGHIYDPMSGKTYKATLKLDGANLNLHGYVGISLIGRTETWHRAPVTSPCS